MVNASQIAEAHNRKPTVGAPASNFPMLKKGRHYSVDGKNIPSGEDVEFLGETVLFLIFKEDYDASMIWLRKKCVTYIREVLEDDQ